MESQLDRQVREHQRLLDRKAELDMQTKENNAAKEALEQEICRLLKLDQLDSSAGVIANERQLCCVEEAWKSMEQAKQALDGGETLDAVNVCIDSAIDSLLELTGERASNAVIDQVFERFCVGK